MAAPPVERAQMTSCRGACAKAGRAQHAAAQSTTAVVSTDLMVATSCDADVPWPGRVPGQRLRVGVDLWRTGSAAVLGGPSPIPMRRTPPGSGAAECARLRAGG